MNGPADLKAMRCEKTSRQNRLKTSPLQINRLVSSKPNTISRMEPLADAYFCLRPQAPMSFRTDLKILLMTLMAWLRAIFQSSYHIMDPCVA